MRRHFWSLLVIGLVVLLPVLTWIVARGNLTTYKYTIRPPYSEPLSFEADVRSRIYFSVPHVYGFYLSSGSTELTVELPERVGTSLSINQELTPFVVCKHDGTVY